MRCYAALITSGWINTKFAFYTDGRVFTKFVYKELGAIEIVCGYWRIDMLKMSEFGQERLENRGFLRG
jgi:exonuclease III